MMSLSLKPSSLKRYKDILTLFYKYGHGDLVKGAPLIDDPLPHAPPPALPPEAKELAKDLEKLGPTYIKLGQLVSTRADFVPQAYMEALARLQDKVEPFPSDQVHAIVSVEIGARITKAFLEFDPKPFAAASLGQVHRAILRSGQPVVVKVQRPDARETVAADLEAMAEMADFLDANTEVGKRYQFAAIVESLRKSLLQELDYRLEAANLKLMRESLKEFEHILIPAPIDDYSSGRVLTMEYVTGQKITQFSPLVRLEMDGPGLAEEVFHAYLHQILVVGVFHADPHPGNVFLTDDKRIALLDLGMVGRVSPRLQDHILKLLVAISEGSSDRAAEVAQKMGERQADFDEQGFQNRIADLVNQQQHRTLDDIQVGRVVLEIQRIAGDCRLRLPSELTLLGKTLLNLDLVGKTLDPDFNPNEAIRRHAAQTLRDRTLRSLSPGNVIGALVEGKEFLERLPARLNQLFELIATNKLKMQVDTIDETLLVTGFQKVANRITLGLILAALIVGASMLMRVETAFRIFGYPGIAMILFFLATLGALALVVQILRSDRSQK